MDVHTCVIQHRHGVKCHGRNIQYNVPQIYRAEWNNFQPDKNKISNFPLIFTRRNPCAKNTRIPTTSRYIPIASDFTPPKTVPISLNQSIAQHIALHRAEKKKQPDIASVGPSISRHKSPAARNDNEIWIIPLGKSCAPAASSSGAVPQDPRGAVAAAARCASGRKWIARR